MQKSFTQWGVFLLLLILTGCQVTTADDFLSVNKHNDRTVIKNLKGDFQAENAGIPFLVDDPALFYIYGWLSDNEIIGHEIVNESTEIFTYNLANGEKIAKLKLDSPIISAKISPSGKSLFIHLSASENLAQFKVIQLETFNIIYETEIESTEVVYEWNSFDERKIFLSAFYEDWTFNSYIIDTESKKMDQISSTQPFAIWKNENELAFLDWDTTGPDLMAPLVAITENGTEQLVPGKEYYYLDNWNDGLLLITTDENNEENANISFLTKELQPLYSFTIPHLIQYSGWHIPNYDDLPLQDSFIMFEPKYSTTLEMYDGDFQLIKRNIRTGESEVVLDSVVDQPITCSPNGEYCLAGYLNENLIKVNEKTIEPFLVAKNE